MLVLLCDKSVSYSAQRFQFGLYLVLISLASVSRECAISVKVPGATSILAPTLVVVHASRP